MEEQRHGGTLAAEILAAHNACLAAMSTALDHAKRAGDLLNSAKEQAKHGEWLPWLATNCPGLSARTAQGYMRIAREWPRVQEANTKRASYLSIREALAVLADEWIDPNDLAPGGCDGDADGDDDDAGDDSPKDSDTTMFRVLFSRSQLAEFQQLFRDAKAVTATSKRHETVLEVFRQFVGRAS